GWDVLGTQRERLGRAEADARLAIAEQTLERVLGSAVVDVAEHLRDLVAHARDGAPRELGEIRQRESFAVARAGSAVRQRLRALRAIEEHLAQRAERGRRERIDEALFARGDVREQTNDRGCTGRVA